MNRLRYTLVSDGSSDAALLPILTWLLRNNGLQKAIQAEWADLGRLHWQTKPSLAEKIRQGVELYPCELLFVHRDAERESREKRVEEIEAALAQAGLGRLAPKSVCVVPVRMQEAWLLFDEGAIKQAAGNRSSREALDLPPLRYLEAVADPKFELHDRLRRASGLHGRRLRSFLVAQRARRVAELIDDFSPLRALLAFQALEHDIRAIVAQQRWAD